MSSSSQPWQQCLDELRRNDEDRTSLTQVDFDGAPVGYGHDLGRALVENLQLTTLLLIVNDLVSTSLLQDLETNSTNVTSSSTQNSSSSSSMHTESEMTNSIRNEPLLDFLAASPTLEHVTLENGRRPRPNCREIEQTIKELLLQALSQNPTDRLTLCSHVHLPPFALSQFLRHTTHSLVRLDFEVTFMRSSSRNDIDFQDSCHLIAAAFGEIATSASCTLQRLTLYYVSTAMEPLIYAILAAILPVAVVPTTTTVATTTSAEPTTSNINCATLCTDRVDRSTNLPRLHVTLHDLPINQACWDAVLRRLVTATVGAYCAIHRPISLTLVECPFDAYVADQIRQVVQTTTTPSDQGVNCSNNNNNMIQWTIRNVECTCALANPQYMSSVLNNDVWRSVASWHLAVEHEVQLQALAHCLPQSKYIKRLHVVLDILDGPDYRPPLEQTRHIPAELLQKTGSQLPLALLQGVRRNGSLHHVKVVEQRPFHQERGRSFFSKRQRYKLAAYLRRNRHLPRLLSTKLHWDDDDNGQRDANNAPAATRSSTLQLVYYPALLTAAMATAPTMAPSHVLLGLMTIDKALSGINRSRISNDRNHLPSKRKLA